MTDRRQPREWVVETFNIVAFADISGRTRPYHPFSSRTNDYENSGFDWQLVHPWHNGENRNSYKWPKTIGQSIQIMKRYVPEWDIARVRMRNTNDETIIPASILG